MTGRFLDEILEQTPAEVEKKPALKKPRKFKVLLLNDDYTPMEFVVRVLMKFFQMDELRATQVMLEVHTKGQGICGVFTRDIAETKVAQAMLYAQNCQHPLLCQMEPD